MNYQSEFQEFLLLTRNLISTTQIFHNRLKIPLKSEPVVASLSSQSLIYFSLFCFQISSVTSMSFLTDPNLTFHRFSDGTISTDGRKAIIQKSESAVWTTGTVLDYSAISPTLRANESATSTTKILSTADETAEDDAVAKRYSTYSSTCNTSTASTHHPTYNGSTLKLIQVQKEDSVDSSSKQVSNHSVSRRCQPQNQIKWEKNFRGWNVVRDFWSFHFW